MQSGPGHGLLPISPPLSCREAAVTWLSWRHLQLEAEVPTTVITASRSCPDCARSSGALLFNVKNIRLKKTTKNTNAAELAKDDNGHLPEVSGARVSRVICADGSRVRVYLPRDVRMEAVRGTMEMCVKTRSDQPRTAPYRSPHLHYCSSFEATGCCWKCNGTVVP